MASARQSSKNARRIPSQARSAQTVEAICDAAIQVLEEEGLERLTTNRVAERAGVSVGTLYQYFSNKNDLLMALAEREARAVFLMVIEAIRNEPPGPRARAIARAFMGVYAHSRTRRLLMETYFTHRGLDHAARSDSFMSMIARPMGQVAGLSPAKLFVLTRAVVGVVRAAAMEQPDIAPQALEDELVTLMRAYVTAETIR